MNECHRDDRQVIDLMLAHASRDKTEFAYNRAAHMPRRRKLAQAWADMVLNEALEASMVIQGPRRGYYASSASLRLLLKETATRLRSRAGPADPSRSTGPVAFLYSTDSI
jgi:hypothetical protein